MDGVLIDVSESIQLVHGLTAERWFSHLGWTNCGGLVLPADVDAFKLAGGFNNDWDVAAAWLLLYLFKSRKYSSTDGVVLRESPPSIREFTADLAERGGHLDSAIAAIREMAGDDWSAIESQWDREGLVRLFVETYSGDLCSEVYGFEPAWVQGPGLIHRDRAILDRALVPPDLKLAIATGRTRGEAHTGLRLMGWADIFAPDCVITEDDGVLKPDPGILDLAVRRISARHPMYVGDSPDDLLTVQRYKARVGRMLACMVLTGVGNRSSERRETYIAQSVDLIADNVNAALVAVTQIKAASHES